MDNVHVTGSVLVDSSSVVFKGLRYRDTAGDGASLVDLLHHVLLTLDGSELVDSVLVVGVRDEARLVGVAVSALLNGGALDSVVVASSSVKRAGLVSNVVLLDIVEG